MPLILNTISKEVTFIGIPYKNSDINILGGRPVTYA
jgi:hypothetical protein